MITKTPGARFELARVKPNSLPGIYSIIGIDIADYRPTGLGDPSSIV